MGNTDAEYVFIFVLLFGLIGFIVPFLQLEFGGTVATFDVEGAGSAGILGVLNAITSILFWTFGVSVWINLLILTPLRVMMWFILLRNSPVIGSGGA